MGLKNQDPFDIVQLYAFDSDAKSKCGHARVDRFDKRHDENVRKWGPGVTTPLGEPMYRHEAEEIEAANRCDTDYSGELDFGDAGGSSVGEVLAGLGKVAAVGGCILLLAKALSKPKRKA